jgi:hypothetical protein
MNTQNVENVLTELMKQCPIIEKELKEALHCYQHPLEVFCQREAEYRLNERFNKMKYCIPEKNKMEAELANALYISENYCDGDIADLITDIVIRNHAYDLSKKEDYEKCKKDYVNGKNPLLINDEDKMDSIVALLCDICKNNTEEFKAKLKEKLKDDTEFLTLRETIKFATAVLTTIKGKIIFEHVQSKTEDFSEWVQIDEWQWMRRISLHQFAFLEVRITLDKKYYLCGGLIDTIQYKEHWKDVVNERWDLFMEKFPDLRDYLLEIAKRIFKQTDSYSLYCFGPYKTPKEASAIFDRVDLENPCKGCMGAAFGDCGICTRV